MSTFNTDENAQITEVTGHLLFASYSLASVLVALNLLIAMLSNTFQKVDVSLFLVKRPQVNSFSSVEVSVCLFISYNHTSIVL